MLRVILIFSFRYKLAHESATFFLQRRLGNIFFFRGHYTKGTRPKSQLANSKLLPPDHHFPCLNILRAPLKAFAI